ncbi:hypothetical protein SISSUDRAFT_13576 [Sistotremastrum suecicum HHB10207 ss-3]|uniref:Uncharacterized protein n=1 Tax=Sistotremastrum suecicum HHB10207 ss-3 TaxID=1314776 RepID=A0A166J5F3_9AGAM|nr:hypothetical protein SISSUDRAFT_13576 [Sistotremastrum suecicum HHB10207 ss-3]
MRGTLVLIQYRYRPQDDVYPNKRSAHSATPTLNVIHNVKPLPVHIEIIDLVDDDLESTMLLPTQPTLQCSRDEPSTTLPVPPSHLSTSPPGSAHDSPDESDEYSFIHQGFDASSSIWLKSQFSSVPDTSSVFDRLTSSAEGSLRHALDQIMEPELGFSRATYLRAFQREHLVWPMMKHARCPPVRWRRLYSGQQFNRHQTSCNIGRKLGLIGLQYDPMPEFHAAGDITSIVQSADVVVVASATPGGSNEVADDPYNQSGTLLCYHNATKKVEFKNAHFASHESDQEITLYRAAATEPSEQESNAWRHRVPESDLPVFCSESRRMPLCVRQRNYRCVSSGAKAFAGPKRG